MSVFKNILGRVFALWAIVLFCTTLLLVALLLLLTNGLSQNKRNWATQHIFEGWMKVFFVCTGVRRIFKGYENFKPGQVYVITCNHRSYMDPPLSSIGIPAPNRTIAKDDMARIPVFGIIYRRGSVLVNRRSEESRRQSYLRMRDVLRQGLHMCIYPEGTRNRTPDPLLPFHDGAFRLAVESGHAVMPAVLFYTERVLPTNKTFYYWPHRVEMHFLPAVPVAGKTIASLKAEVFEITKQHYQRHKQ